MRQPAPIVNCRSRSTGTMICASRATAWCEMPRTSAQTVAQLVAQAGGVRQYLALAGIPAAPRPPKGQPPSPEYRAYRAARRSVERAITTRGKERHTSIAPKYAAKAEKAERNLRHRAEARAAAPAPQPAPAAG